MNNEGRETKEIVTPLGKNKVIIKTWLTAKEKREIMNVYLEGTNIKGDSSYELPASKFYESQDATLKTMIISIDGNAENIIDQALGMRSEDFEFIIKEINKLTTDDQEEIKK